MKKLQVAAVLTLFALSLCGAASATDVGVSVTVGDPGFYGRLDLGSAPPPRLIYEQPVIIRRGPSAPPPVYLHVPPGHAKNWSKHCAQYHACNQPVYFVQDNWYQQVYVPSYQQSHGKGHGRDDDDGHGKGHDKGHGNGHD